MTKPDEDVSELKSSILLKFLKGKPKNSDEVVLTYENDEPAEAAAVPAHVATDPGPAVAAVVPPPAPVETHATGFVDPMPMLPDASIHDAKRRSPRRRR